MKLRNEMQESLQDIYDANAAEAAHQLGMFWIESDLDATLLGEPLNTEEEKVEIRAAIKQIRDHFLAAPKRRRVAVRRALLKLIGDESYWDFNHVSDDPFEVWTAEVVASRIVEFGLSCKD